MRYLLPPEQVSKETPSQEVIKDSELQYFLLNF